MNCTVEDRIAEAMSELSDRYHALLLVCCSESPCGCGLDVDYFCGAVDRRLEGLILEAVGRALLSCSEELTWDLPRPKLQKICDIALELRPLTLAVGISLRPQSSEVAASEEFKKLPTDKLHEIGTALLLMANEVETERPVVWN